MLHVTDRSAIQANTTGVHTNRRAIQDNWSIIQANRSGIQANQNAIQPDWSAI